MWSQIVACFLGHNKKLLKRITQTVTFQVISASKRHALHIATGTVARSDKIQYVFVK